MKFFSTSDKNITASFREAVIRGLAPDKGLYYPESIPQLPDSFFEKLPSLSLAEIGYEVALPFVQEDIPATDLRTLVEDAMSFDTPIVKVEEGIYTLELFHGPTLAFKDVGARFMARCLGYFNRGNDQEVTVLVATSGDTGGAVANGFYKVPGVNVVILYPSGKVSDIQERQLTTLGENITALEVDGTFDDCQRMVKDAFMDQELNNHMNLTSANSINIARLLPQSFYYFRAYGQLNHPQEDVFMCVPSGNFGNITAGLFAQKMGLPIKHYIAGTNANSIVPEFLKSGEYNPRPSVATISNAMDVGDPSNFVRMQELYQHSLPDFQSHVSGYSFSDDATKVCMKEIYDQTQYTLDPHGAVGYLSLKEYMRENNGTGIFLETAHPVKFLDVVEDAIGISPAIPSQLEECMSKEKVSIKTGKEYQDLKDYLMNR